MVKIVKCPYCETIAAKHQISNFIGVTRCSNCNRSYSIHYSLGKDLMEQGKYDEAIESFLKALKNFKNTALIYIDLAEALTNLSDSMLERRKDALRRAIEIDEDLSIEFIKDRGWKM